MVSTIRLAAMGAVVAGFVGVAAPGHAANCLYPDKGTNSGPSYACLRPGERALIELRKFRADLTVAALRCNQQQVYNDIVSRHRSELVQQGQALRTVFRRLHGKSAASELNRYVTHLTNRASISSLNVRNYCGTMARVFAAALSVPVQGLMSFIGGGDLLARVAAKDGYTPVSLNDSAAAKRK